MKHQKITMFSFSFFGLCTCMVKRKGLFSTPFYDTSRAIMKKLQGTTFTTNQLQSKFSLILFLIQMIGGELWYKNQMLKTSPPCGTGSPGGGWGVFLHSSGRIPEYFCRKSALNHFCPNSFCYWLDYIIILFRTDLTRLLSTHMRRAAVAPRDSLRHELKMPSFQSAPCMRSGTFSLRTCHGRQSGRSPGEGSK